MALKSVIKGWQQPGESGVLFVNSNENYYQFAGFLLLFALIHYSCI